MFVIFRISERLRDLIDDIFSVIARYLDEINSQIFSVEEEKNNGEISSNNVLA